MVGILQVQYLQADPAQPAIQLDNATGWSSEEALPQITSEQKASSKRHAPLQRQAPAERQVSATSKESQASSEMQTLPEEEPQQIE